MCPGTNSNINRKNKDGLSSDSGELSSSRRGERRIYDTVLVDKVIDILVMMTQRGFFVFEKR
jgi:hypothetical protein